MNYELISILLLLIIIVQGSLNVFAIIGLGKKKDTPPSPEAEKLESIRVFREVLVHDRAIRNLAKNDMVSFEQTFHFLLSEGAIEVKTIIGGEDLGAIRIDYIYGDRDVASQLFDHYEKVEENYMKSQLIKNLIG